MPLIHGSCLCGQVHYTFDGEITEIAKCHCSQCRKAQGSAFACNSPIARAKIHFSGREHIREYQSSDAKVRAFCQNCGSPLYSARSDKPETIRLRLGSVDTEFRCENQYHIYAESKAVWGEIHDSYPQYARGKDIHPI